MHVTHDVNKSSKFVSEQMPQNHALIIFESNTIIVVFIKTVI